jgi:hypothetical protein
MLLFWLGQVIHSVFVSKMENKIKVLAIGRPIPCEQNGNRITMRAPTLQQKVIHIFSVLVVKNLCLKINNSTL